MKKTTPNKARIIFEENDYPYYQDMGFHRGVPAGVEFEIDSWDKATADMLSTRKGNEIVYKLDVRQGTLSLSAPGYGREPYGNGSIEVYPADIFKQATILQRRKLCPKKTRPF